MSAFQKKVWFNTHFRAEFHGLQGTRTTAEQQGGLQGPQVGRGRPTRHHSKCELLERSV